MDVLLWSCFNYVVGSFPLFLARENNEIKFTKCWLWLLFLILNIAASCSMFVSVCQLYNFPSVELQKYRCYLSWFLNIIVLLRRMTLTKSIEKLFTHVLSVFSCESFFSVGKYMIILQVTIGLIKYFGLIYSAPKTLFMKIGLIINYVYILGPVFIDSQCIIICYGISDELDQLNKLMSLSIKSMQDFEKFKVRLKQCKNIFCKFLNIYMFDIFLSVTFSCMDACACFYSLINIARFVFQSFFTWRVFILKLVFYSAFFLGLFMSVSWFCIKADTVANKVKSLSCSIYKIDLQSMENKLKDEVILIADQLEGCSFSVMGFGFFTVNLQFIFKGFVTAMSLIILFVQLAHMRYQREKQEKST